MRLQQFMTEKRKTDVSCDTCEWNQRSMFGEVCTNPDWYDKTPYSNRIGIPAKIDMAKKGEKVLPSCPIVHPKKKRR
jgi:hypothetical protein